MDELSALEIAALLGGHGVAIRDIQPDSFFIVGTSLKNTDKPTYIISAVNGSFKSDFYGSGGVIQSFQTSPEKIRIETDVYILELHKKPKEGVYEGRFEPISGARFEGMLRSQVSAPSGH